MAALAAGQITQQWAESTGADAVGTFAVSNVTAGDTADLAQWFSVVKRAVYLGESETTAASCTVSGTVVTIPTGPSADTGYITAYGDSAY